MDAVTSRLTYAFLVALIVITPWPLGTRLPWVSMLTVVAVTGVGITWLMTSLILGHRIRTHPLMAPIAVFLIWTGLQWILGWTIYAQATAIEWVRWFSYAVVFALTVQVARQGSRARGMVRAIAASGIAVGIFGLVQFLTWNGRMFWVYDPPYTGNPFGPFNNRNYFAGYLIVTLAVLLALLLGRGLQRNRAVYAYLGWLAGLSVLVSLSRGGAVALAAVLGTTIVLGPASSGETRDDRARPGERGPTSADLSRRRSGPHRNRRALIPRLTEVRLSARVLLVVGVVAAVLVGLAGLQQADRVIASLETIWNFASEVSFQGRWTIWRDTTSMIAEHPWRGFGLNTFGWVLPRFQSEPNSLIFMHAHNEYLEMIAETGAIGGAIAIWFLAIFFLETRRRLQAARQPWERAVHLAGLAAWVGILVFSLTDFPTIIPAINYALAILAALATTEIETSGRHRSVGG